ncbi:MAG: hypothetical protein GC185_00785 [Alphaproteobacteria bacterium]|nr:hypothetical protein [Alphaproteobacteria bacterium]
MTNSVFATVFEFLTGATDTLSGDSGGPIKDVNTSLQLATASAGLVASKSPVAGSLIAIEAGGVGFVSQAVATVNDYEMNKSQGDLFVDGLTMLGDASVFVGGLTELAIAMAPPLAPVLEPLSKALQFTGSFVTFTCAVADREQISNAVTKEYQKAGAEIHAIIRNQWGRSKLKKYYFGVSA